MTTHRSDREQLLAINDAELCVETFGDPAAPAIVLVAGAAASMLWWDAELCARIAAGGRFVVRYDQRDTGRSTCYPPGRPVYSFTDLARDVLGIQDALGLERAHVVCQSMFGGIGLILGVDHPHRLASLTFVSSSTGADGLPPPSSDLASPAAPNPTDTAAVVEYVVAGARADAGGSPYFDESAIRTLAGRDVARARNYASTLTNHYAIEFDGPALDGFGDITVPTLVVHGDRDPLLPLPHGEALRDAIPGARLRVLEGAGHDLPRPLWDDFVSALVQHTAEPDPEQLASPRGTPLTGLSWADVRTRVAGAGDFLLATTDPDGRPHVVPVLAVWLDGTVCVVTFRQSRKARNLERNDGCAVTVPGPDVDVVLEGTAQLVRDAARLQAVADLFPAKYPWWHPFVRDGEFYDPADTAVSDPRHVYAVEPAQVFAFGKEDGFSATRWRLKP